MNELREKISKILIDHGLRSDTLLLEQLLSLVDKPKVDTGELKECPTCGKVKESKPTPDGDEICPCCGDKEMVDYEVTQTPDLEEVKRKFAERFVASDVFNVFEWSDRNKEIFNFFTPLLATKEHDEALLREFVDFLPKEFWEDEDHAVGGYISKKDLRGKVGDFIASRKDKPTTDLKVDNSGEGE